LCAPDDAAARPGTGGQAMTAGSRFAGFARSANESIAAFESALRRPGAVPILIVVLWACAVLPNLSVRAFIFEEGTNAEIARDILTRGDFLQPYVYGIRWHEKPSLLSWLIAGFAKLTGGVNEWSARLPTMLSVLVTALLVQALTRRYASLNASLFAALAFIFCPLLLQKLTIAEPDSLLTALSFAALVVWWSGVAAKRLTIFHWIGSGLLLSALAMTKGPQPVAFFGLGVFAYLLSERRWRDLPGWLLCMIMPAATIVAWGAAVYRPGDEASWISYARLNGWPPFSSYMSRSLHDIGSLYLELLPASLLIPFIPWPWQWAGRKPNIPAVVAPMILYSGVCTAILVWWPGFNTRYAMPIAPSLAVLAAIAWDRLEMSRYVLMRRGATTVLCLLVAYQIVLSVAGIPLVRWRFEEDRTAGQAIEQAILAEPAPAYCLRLDTNVFFYVHVPLRCLDLQSMAALDAPAWLLMPHTSVEEFAKLRPDLNVRIVKDGLTQYHFAAARIERK
jgi:4-amino-4-deoxy-L-arabinose transferase-like glycosyltransferase